MSTKNANEILQLREINHYNLRHSSLFTVHPVHSVYNGTKSAAYLRPKIWEMSPSEIKNIDSFTGFK